MSTMASQITSLTIVYSAVYSGRDQRKHQSSASLAIVRGIHRWPVNSPHKWPVTRNILPFDDVIMNQTKTFYDSNTEHLLWLVGTMWRCGTGALLQTKWLDAYSVPNMMTSSNGDIFRVTGPLCWEFTGPRWIPRTKASDAKLWCFLWSATE